VGECPLFRAHAAEGSALIVAAGMRVALDSYFIPEPSIGHWDHANAADVAIPGGTTVDVLTILDAPAGGLDVGLAVTGVSVASTLPGACPWSLLVNGRQILRGESPWGLTHLVTANLTELYPLNYRHPGGGPFEVILRATNTGVPAGAMRARVAGRILLLRRATL